MLLRKGLTTGFLALVCVVSAQAKEKTIPVTPLSADHAAIVDRAIAREKVTLTSLQQRTPLIETYIQNMRPDPLLLSTPESDQYFIGRVDFHRVIGSKMFKEEKSGGGLFHGSMNFMGGLTKAFKLEYLAAGFTQMMVLDTSSFDREHYNFQFVGRAFLGDIRTLVFDVSPNPEKAKGRFVGRIWIEDRDNNIVRLNGVYTGSDFDTKSFFHFDSWRTNVQQTLWLPSLIYTEETRGKDAEHPVSFKAQTRVWGYNLKTPTHEQENSDVKIDAVQDQSQSQDISPLQAERMWVTQAETNILDRLQQAGLLAAPSEVDKLLETVTNNIVVSNNISVPETFKCRVLLTTPLESISIGNTILVSRGLIDVLPDEQSLAMVLSFQLAHILLGHRIDTKYAFNDRLLFPDESAFQRIAMSHSSSDNEDAAKKAAELLQGSVYKDKLATAGLFLNMLHQRAPALKNLNEPRIGDSMIRDEKTGEVWMSAIESKSPKLDMAKLDQIPALPIGSRVRVDSWDDKVYILNAKPVPYYTARDKMPFEVTPVAIRLVRYQSQVAAAAPAGATGSTAEAQPAEGQSQPQQ